MARHWIRRRLAQLCLTTLVAAATIVLPPGPARADHVKCEDVIVQDTRLDSDLQCECLGLTVLGNVTLDLGGHTITGPGRGHSPDELHEGIVTEGGFGPTIQNGTMRGFDSAIRAAATGGLTTIRDLTLLDSGAGIAGLGPLAIERNTLRGNSYGVVVQSTANGPVTIRMNRVLDTTLDGMHLGGSFETLVDRNVVVASGDTGIRVASAGRALLSRNRANHNAGDGIHAAANTTTLIGNRTLFNGDLGIEALPGASGGRNLARHNGNPAQCAPGSLCKLPKRLLGTAPIP